MEGLIIILLCWVALLEYRCRKLSEHINYLFYKTTKSMLCRIDEIDEMQRGVAFDKDKQLQRDIWDDWLYDYSESYEKDRK